MNELLFKTFIERYNKDKEEFTKRFEDLDSKIDRIGDKLDHAEECMGKLGKRLSDIEEVQAVIFGKSGGFGSKLENVKIYLSAIEDKLNEYKMLTIQGQKTINGEIYLLKIQLQKVKPVISWENDSTLLGKYREIEGSFRELEEYLNL